MNIENKLNIKEFLLQNNVIKLKTTIKFFESVWNGNKTFDIRKDDRDYKLGDILLLREYKPKYDHYTGRVILAKVNYILTSESYPEALMPDYVVLAIATIAKEEHYQELTKL